MSLENEISAYSDNNAYEIATYVGWGAIILKSIYYLQMGVGPFSWHTFSLWFAMMPSLMVLTLDFLKDIFEVQVLSEDNFRRAKRFARTVEIAE